MNSIAFNPFPITNFFSARQSGSQLGLGTAFRSVAASLPQNTASPSISVQSLRSAGSLNALMQPSAVAAMVTPREPFDIRNYYPHLSEAELLMRLNMARWTFDNADFSGMSEVEIYGKIESWFIEQFGENFMKAYALNTGWINSFHSNGGQKWTRAAELNDIGSAFDRIINNALGGRDNVREVNRERLFGDMSTAEIKDTIRARYPENLTNRDLFLMFHEMQSVGVFSDESQRGTTIRCVLSGYMEFSTMTQDASGNWAGNNRMWDTLLNESVNVRLLLGVYNESLYVGRRLPSSEATNFLKDFFGGVKGANGWFKNATNVREVFFASEELDLSTEFAHEIPDLLEYFLRRWDEHRELLWNDSHDANVAVNEKLKEYLIKHMMEGITSND